MMISAVFVKKEKKILCLDRVERLSISLMGSPELVSEEYNLLKKKYIDLGYEVE